MFTCMWLCSEEVEEKPRLHTLHLKGLLELRAGSSGKVSGGRGRTSRGRDRLPVRLQVDLQVIRAGEGRFALLAAVLLVACIGEKPRLSSTRAACGCAAPATGRSAYLCAA